MTPTGSSSYTAEDLIADSTGPHEGTLCGVDGYDWQYHGVIQAAGPGSYSAGTGWGVFQWQDCGAHVAGVRVQVRGVRAYALTSSGWVQYASGSPWCATRDTNTSTGGGNCTGTAGDWLMPDAVRSLHWGTWQSGLPLGTECQAVTGEARIVGSGRVMMDFGSDWWPNVGATSGNGGAVVGRYRLLSETWLFFGASSCPADVLRSVGMP